jgi:predicted glycosyltransferase involved in capsule biosynthesis
MKYDLKDTTFIIPVRIDSVIRLENLLLTLNNLEDNFDTNIIIVEASYYNNGILKKLIGNTVSYFFIEDKDPIFHRTKHLNTISEKVDTDIIGIWDTDVILESSQIIEAVQQLRDKSYDFAYPYDGRFLDISEIIRNHYLLYKDMDFLKKHTLKMNLLYSSIKEGNSLGGAFLISTDKYKLSGLENEAFYGWGVEDGERYHRWLILNFSFYRSKGALFHLTHPRDINGTMRSEYHYSKTEDEMRMIINSTKEELENKFQCNRNSLTN